MTKTSRNEIKVPRIAYSYAEFAAMVGRDRGWVYRQVAAGKLRAVQGFGSGMIPASEAQRVFGSQSKEVES